MKEPLFFVEDAEPRSPGAQVLQGTSDLRRSRALLWMGLACATGGVASVAVSKDATISPGPMSAPHRAAGLTCASCHAAGDGATKACVTCHEAHPSTREGHRALAAKGALRCVDCHAPHGDGETVALAADGTYVRSGGGVEVRGVLSHGAPVATVPLVPLSACVRCHDLNAAKDPIRACVSASGGDARKTASECFDEHATGTSTSASTSTSTSTGVCARQHGVARFAAWDGAREVARTTPWVVAPSRAASSPWRALGAGLVAAGLGWFVASRAPSRRKGKGNTPAAPSAKHRLPRIDTSTCLGCNACVDACPFDVLEIDRFVARVARPLECCGVGTCEDVCPNGSLRITEGEPIEERPEVDEHLESRDVPGLFLAGDLTGMPLIKNALAQGARAIDRIADTLRASERKGDYDVLIIGAGPAGLAAALRAQEKKLRALVLEQSTFASSVRSFPREKLIFDQPLHVPVEGDLWLRECTKEELLAQWTRIVRARELPLREHHRVVGVALRSGEGFVVTARTQSEEVVTFGAPRVLLAIGRRGTPRALDAVIEPGAESSVAYSMVDARAYAGKRVVVVGLGDTAMEAAVALAHQPGTEVTVCHRGEGFRRGKARNVTALEDLVAKGRVTLHFQASVRRVRAGGIVLEVSGTTNELPMDAVLVLIGGTPAWDLLRACGMRIGKNFRPAGASEGP